MGCCRCVRYGVIFLFYVVVCEVFVFVFVVGILPWERFVFCLSAQMKPLLETKMAICKK